MKGRKQLKIEDCVKVSHRLAILFFPTDMVQIIPIEPIEPSSFNQPSFPIECTHQK